MDEGDPDLDVDEEPEWEERTYEIPEEDSDEEGVDVPEGGTTEVVELQDNDVDMSEGTDSKPATPEPEALPSTEPPSKHRKVKWKKPQQATSHAFLVSVADSDISKTTNGFSVSTSAWKIFNDFLDQHETIGKAEASLTKRRRGNTSESLENEEDDADIDH
ncbi:hypothetical protein BT96DRAFT_1002051 [Gymnopus androsaceus JB14]|uniref:Uncharacterized protein n=1 Tax=Gymnopus androsaceus JB14 TaxID=1447944 RepID=A0A6A4GY35_9AGAR|nr:hypothetical protein BT96DRAFT_1002051 [Gymnopus androsaceus JB14]